MLLNEIVVGQKLFSLENPSLVYTVRVVDKKGKMIYVGWKTMEFKVPESDLCVFVPYSVVESFSKYKKKGTYNLYDQLRAMMKKIKEAQ